MIEPSEEQLIHLSSFERRAFQLADFVNRNEKAKRVSQAFLSSVGARWVYLCSRNLTHIIGVDNVRNLSPSRGLLLASNHRSFFDQFVIACYLYQTSNLLQKTYFPVRADFFYQRPEGIFISLIMSGLTMYPPVFRESQKRAFNDFSVSRLIEILDDQGSVVGMHPEGTRNRGSDPYTLLPAQPGIGKLIYEARPTVLPIFINGLTNRFFSQAKSNFNGSGTPIVIVFGKGLDLEEFYERPSKLRTHKEIADRVRDEIRLLGERERKYRKRLMEEPVPGPVFIGPFPEYTA